MYGEENAQKEQSCFFNCCSSRHCGDQDQEAQRGAIKALAADCALLQGMERRCFHFDGKIPPKGGDVCSEHSAEIRLCAVRITALPTAATGHEHPLFVRRRDKLQDFLKSFQYIHEHE